MNPKLRKFQERIELQELVHAAGVTSDPMFQEMMEWTLSPLENGGVGEEMRLQLENMLIEPALRNLLNLNQPQVPVVPPEKAIYFGYAA